jgi:hypothetical protein
MQLDPETYPQLSPWFLYIWILCSMTLVKVYLTILAVLSNGYGGPNRCDVGIKDQGKPS